METLSYEQFLKAIQEGTEEKKRELYDYFWFGMTERHRQRVKARKQYERKRQNKIQSSE